MKFPFKLRVGNSASEVWEEAKNNYNNKSLLYRIKHTISAHWWFFKRDVIYYFEKIFRSKK